MRVTLEARQASAFTKFKLLMWKNFKQQWRHPKQTAIEILLPVLVMSLVLIIRWQVEPESRGETRFPAIPAHTLTYSLPVIGGMQHTQMDLAYSPESPILDSVVRSAASRLILTNLNVFFPDLPIDFPVDSPEIIGIVNNFIRLQAFNNSAAMQDLFLDEENTKKTIAAVEFGDELYGATILPINVTYSLRFPERPRLNSFYNTGGRTWRTDRLFPYFEIPGPRFPYSWEGGNEPGYINEMFIALQHVISSQIVSTLLTSLTGEDLSPALDVYVQRYPYPAFIEDLAVTVLQILFPLFIMLSLSYTAVNLTRAITLEKELQLKESMKIMGLPTWLHWTACFCKQFIYLILVCVFIVVLLKVNWFTNEEGFSDYAVFTNTPWSVLYFYLVLYIACTIFFCFMISGCFSKGSTAALFTGVIWFMTYIPAFLLAVDIEMGRAMEVITCLFINSAMSYGFQLLLAKETTGGMQWGEFFDSPTSSARFNFGMVVIMILVDCVLFMLIALYLEQVFPGPYGLPKKWYFFVQKSYWFPHRVQAVDVAVEDFENTIIKEEDPKEHPAGVKIRSLTKVFGPNIAVNNLTLNIYDNQITVLLGHNGAGKSTTIAMLTGNLQPSQGSVQVAGYDVSKQTSLARAHLGFCPQHNVIFNELTVREHLEFFSRLKGYKGKELEYEIDELIEKLELQDKRDYQSDGLSGGQKRRLCVGIALSGGAKVVLLDEPTSGMDPASRRALWDLLQKEKKDRSMILTTHFMDEADYLGDRVAIMASGKLQCVGSPYFLKQHYGVGYTLVIVKAEGFRQDVCTELVRKYIPGIDVKEDRGLEVTYGLRNEYSHIFERLLNDLEGNIDNIKFKNYGLTATSMEDVFMSVGSETQVPEDDETTSDFSADFLKYTDSDGSSIERLDTQTFSVTGWRLLYQHVWAIWLKLWLVWTRSWVFILMQLLVPLLIIMASLGVMEYVASIKPTVMSRSLTLAEGFSRTETVLSYNGSSATSIGSQTFQSYKDMYDNVPREMEILISDASADEYYLERGADSVELARMRHLVLIGATIDDTKATAWFSNFGYHDVAITLATLHNALLKSFEPNAQINVNNHPLHAEYIDKSDMQLQVQMLSGQVAQSVGTSIAIVSAVFILFYIKERVSRAKLLQMAAGIEPVVFWGSSAIFDWLWFAVISVTVVIACVSFQVTGLSTTGELGRMYLCLLLYGAAFLPLNYLLSHLFNGPAIGFVVAYFINVLFGMMGAQIVEALTLMENTKFVSEVMDYILQFFPLYSLVTSITRINKVGLQVQTCLELCDKILPVFNNLTECTMDSMCGAFPDNCCVRDNPYFDWEEPGILRYMLSMIASWTVFWAILLIKEYNLLQKIWTPKKTPPPLDKSTIDQDVLDEMRHVEMVSRGDLTKHGLVAHAITKYYDNNLAVDQVSFTVSDGECFGLLGVNGAGKTTTFKMLMGDESVSSGDAFVAGHSVKTQINKVHENIGYCPQFDAVFVELTGRENLRVFSLLRGLSTDDATRRADVLAAALGFSKHIDKKVENYSGGNKRKLSTAIALLGNTRLVFVDEPTTGVDPAAKRQVWRALTAAQKAGRGVVLTSHSMEECEALCSRLTIMVNGRFQCLGTPQHLKNKFSQGFTLTIKMKLNEDEDPRDSEVNSPIKSFVENNFTTPKLMEEYNGLLTYYLPSRSTAWSTMFASMERARSTLSVEDYSIAQTTLEQIFLQFTKYQREGLN